MNLATSLKTKRAELGLSYRQVSAETGVSASTLQRFELERLNNHDVDTNAAIADWVGESLSTGAVVSSIDRPMPDIVRDILIRDKSLSPSEVEGLSTLFEVAYRTFTKK